MKKFSFLFILIGFIFASECGIFTNVLQTRNDDSDIEINSGTSYIHNAPSCELNTKEISKSLWRVLKCYETDKEAKASGNYGKKLNIDYNFTIQSSNAQVTPSSSTNDVTINNNATLSDAEYNKVKMNKTNKKVTFDYNGDKKINDLWVKESDVVFKNMDNHILAIGTLETHDSGGESNIDIQGNPQKIEINNIDLYNHTTITLQSNTEIDINTIAIHNHGSDMIIKAPMVVINSIDYYPSDSYNFNLTIEADNIDIKELDLNKNFNLRVKPSNNQKVVFHSDKVQRKYSSSHFIVDSGDYYIKDFNITGNYNVDIIHASSSDEIINVYTNGLTIPDNTQLNTDYTNEDVENEENPPANMRFFIDGNLDIHKNDTLNALFYVEGGVNRIGKETYIRGAISSGNSITNINSSNHFYWDDSIDGSNYGKCLDYQNHYVCGIFPTPLNSYTHINAQGNNPLACFTTSIAYPEGELEGTIKCDPNACGNTDNICQRVDPPLNKLNYSFPANLKEGVTENTSMTELTKQYYGNFDKFYQANVHLNPQESYENNSNIKVMVLGDVTIKKSTLRFEPGDYFFNSLTIEDNNNYIVLPNGGPVRIFVKNDFNVNLNNFHLNSDGYAGNLFIYIGGNFNSIGNGGGTTLLKGFIYVKGNTILNNNSNNWKIYGAITSEGDISINGNNPDFIGGSNADNLGYGECDMCYEQPKNGSGMSFNIGSCPGIDIGMFSKIYVPVKSNDTLNNVSVDELHKKSLFSLTMFNTNKVVDQDGNPVRDANQHDDGLFNAGFLGIEASLFDEKIVTYPLGDDNYTYGPTDNNNYQQLYTYTLFDFDFCKWYESLVYVGHYDKDGKHYDVIVSPCETNNNNSVYTTGPFDAWDKDKNINNRKITTKIVNKEFNLTIASINQDNNNTEIKPNIDIKYALFDLDTNQYVSEWYDFNASLNKTKIQNFTVAKASKNVKVLFKVCADYNATTSAYTLYPFNRCSENCNPNDKETSNNPCWRKLQNSDAFAIRPYTFKIFGNNQYKRAGEDFNITIKAVDESNGSINSGNIDNVIAIAGYNEYVNDLNISSKFYIPTDDEIRQMNRDVYGIDDTNRSRVAYCPNAGTFSVIGNPQFNNGEVNATLQFSETGILEINVSEKNGSEFAKVDEDDTPDSQRFIKPANIILDKDDINKTDLLMFIPYKFETDGDVNTIPESPNNWIYMSNDVNKSNETNETPKMAGFITYDIKAYSKDGNQLKNYTKTCFPDTEDSAPKKNGLKLNTTFDLFLDTDLNITKNATASFYTTDNNDNAICTMNKEVDLNEGNNLLKEKIGATNFENGEGIAKIYFNINKNYKIPSEEINITINDINTSTSWMNNPGATNKFIGKNINKTIEFRYGRIHVKEATRIGNEVNTTFKYEYWDKNKGWVINIEHSKDFGEVNLSKSYVDATQFDNSPMKNSRAYDVENGLQNVKFTTTHSLPYSAKVHLSIPNWLWYNPLAKDYKDPSSSNHDCRTHPCMKVTFYPNSSGWAGISGGSKKLQKEFNESKRTVEVNTSKEVNVSKKEVKKINW